MSADREQGAPRPLEGRGVVITRPAPQSAGLAALVAAAGGRPILFPVMEIRDVPPSPERDAIIDRLHEYDFAIFISPNAAAKGLEAIGARRAFPQGLTVAAIGGGTARALLKHGIRATVVPAGRADSESLLAQPELAAMAGKRVVVFRGVGGREVLRNALVERGASVDYAECYERARPPAEASALLRALSAGEVDALVVTSSEGLRSFHALLAQDARRLALTPVFVPHPRIAATAQKLGVDKVVVTDSGDEGIVATLAAYFADA
ncbi:MAG TPA: uroporphyrinogen-III synthase [Burkholderiales bacterium]|nr:uroporphyrinogen-III synthase [Burkholderiales bacterium]